MSKTLIDIICVALVNELKASSVNLYGNVDTKYIDEWFKDADASNFSTSRCTLNTILNCTPESVVKDIYANYVVRLVANRLRKHDCLHTVSVEMEKKLLSYNDPVTIFKVYYGDIKALNDLTKKIATELGIRFYKKFNCLDFLEDFKKLKNGETIAFTVKPPHDETVHVYEAYHVLLHDLDIYGVNSSDSVGFATVSYGPQNIEVGMITELAKYYGDLDGKSVSYDGGGVNCPTIYVLE